MFHVACNIDCAVARRVVWRPFVIRNVSQTTTEEIRRPASTRGESEETENNRTGRAEAVVSTVT